MWDTNLIPTGVLKEKSTSAIGRFEGSILGAQEGAKMAEFQGVKKAIFSL